MKEELFAMNVLTIFSSRGSQVASETQREKGRFCSRKMPPDNLINIRAGWLGDLSLKFRQGWFSHKPKTFITECISADITERLCWQFSTTSAWVERSTAAWVAGELCVYSSLETTPKSSMGVPNLMLPLGKSLSVPQNSF